jgi:hypothetical protein
MPFAVKQKEIISHKIKNARAFVSQCNRNLQFTITYLTTHEYRKIQRFTAIRQ